MNRTDIFANISDEWMTLLQKKKADVAAIDHIIANVNAATCTPPANKWFEWARLTSLADTRVLILGQDPYPGHGTAHGLAFSSLNDFPGSLQNIYKCLQHHKLIANYRDTTTNLESWARQGVLLLNTSLSTEIGKTKAHMELWSAYIRRILIRILQYHIESHLIIMCWGNVARDFIHGLIVKNRHKFIILEWCHPSPLTGTKFITCDHFVLTNNYLKKLKWAPIAWNSIETKAQPKQLIFTDGSANSPGNKSGAGNKKDKNCVGGYAAVFLEGGPMQSGAILGNLDTSQHFASNIRAEGAAIIAALEKCVECDVKSQIDIYSDSEFWIKMLEKYMQKWSADDFQTKANPDLTTRMWALWAAARAKHTIQLNFIYSHNKSGAADSPDPFVRMCAAQNALADKLACQARLKLNSGQQQYIALPADNQNMASN